jgi:hypothetical protein
MQTVPTRATEKCTVGLEWQVRMLDLKGIFAGLAGEVCSECGGKPSPARNASSTTAESCGQPQADLLVTDFVDLTTLEPKSVGVLLGEAMKSGLSQSCCRRIQQVELAKYFKLTDRGLVALTRDAEKIAADQFRPAECIIGTYTLTADKLILFVRRVNLQDGAIVRMASREITFSCTDSNLKYKVQ